jgi:hypothetical protein
MVLLSVLSLRNGLKIIMQSNKFTDYSIIALWLTKPIHNAGFNAIMKDYGSNENWWYKSKLCD